MQLYQRPLYQIDCLVYLKAPFYKLCAVGESVLNKQHHKSTLMRQNKKQKLHTWYTVKSRQDGYVVGLE